jgi:hypothetical protein
MLSASRALVYEPKGAPPADTLQTDDYLSKLVKYIPGEVLAIFTPIAAFLGTDKWQVLVMWSFGAIGVVGWLYLNAQKVPARQRRPYAYGLGLIAFVGWAIGVSAPVRHLLWGLSDDWGGIILFGAAFLIPILDGALGIWWKKHK